MREKLLSSVSPMALEERRKYYPPELYFTEDMVYINRLDADNPSRDKLPIGVPRNIVLYVLRTVDGQPILIADTKERLFEEVEENELELYALH